MKYRKFSPVMLKRSQWYSVLYDITDKIFTDIDLKHKNTFTLYSFHVLVFQLHYNAFND
jgi:hypothetical protein